MNTYPDSAYGFCEDCRMTNIPAKLEYEGGLSYPVCPVCAERDSDLADTKEAEKCAFGGCFRDSVLICGGCYDPICNIHEGMTGLCDVCSPSDSQFTRGWTPNKYTDFSRSY